MEQARALIDAAIGEDRFSGPRLAAALMPVLVSAAPTRDAFTEASTALGERTARHTVMGLVRAVFLIELVNEAVTSTKFERRWGPRVDGDPRGCSFEECCDIFVQLAAELAGGVHAPEIRHLLDRFRRFATLPYETPVDYIERPPDGAIHRADNLIWIWDDAEIEHTFLLRERVSDTEVVGELTRAFALAGKKTETKTYLTDRALTGVAKTNREKRWEAHPRGVQFAFRRDCLKIEHKLLSQICHFASFPDDVRERLATESAILDMERPARCPITRDPLDFGLLRASLENPEWGQSAFQVGHLNPLKGPGSGSEFGHTPANVAWITADGNRIQGHLSYAETMDLLERIRRNFAKHGA